MDCFEPPLEKLRGLENSQKNRMIFAKHLVFVPSNHLENSNLRYTDVFMICCFYQFF